MNPINFGKFGGLCTCPDGTSYRVADNIDKCKSLNCVGGTVSQCYEVEEPIWLHMGVICEGKLDKKNKLIGQGNSLDHSNYNIDANQKIIIQWDGKIVCIDGQSNLDVNTRSCQAFTYCGSSPKSDIWTCVFWDDKNKSSEMFHYKDCTEEMGFVHCNGLLESSCELKAGIWKEGTLTTTNRYLCDFNDEYQEKILFEICYQMPNAQGVVKCCDVDYT